MKNFKQLISLSIICFAGLNICYASNTEYQPSREDLQKVQAVIKGNAAYQQESFAKLHYYLLKLKTCAAGTYEVPNPASGTIPATIYHIKGWEDNKCVVEMIQKTLGPGGALGPEPFTATITCKYSKETLESMGSAKELEKIRKGELDLSAENPAMQASMTECTVQTSHHEN